MAERCVLVLRAGSPSGNNLIRGLKAADPSLRIIGCHHDPFDLRKSVADRNYLIPDVTWPEFADALHRIIDAERVELVIPNSDVDVLAISRLADGLACRTYLPSRSAVERCRDKYELSTFLAERGLPVPATYAVNNVQDVDEIFHRLSSHSQLWCRSRKGSGSLAALPVESAGQTRAWISYWEEVRGIPPGAFILSEYLPGRDLMVQCLFKRGKPLLAKAFKRLTYQTLNVSPSGVSSIAGVSKMIHEPELIELCIEAMLALDPEASCMFFADLKENANGEACFTEINAGRFSNMPTIHDLTGRWSMCSAYIRAAFDDALEAYEPLSCTDDCYVLRDRDALPVVLSAGELFDGFEDAR